MAYLMTDVAAGSDAALRLQQNMAAAPNVQEVEANKMQAQKNELQAQDINLQKTKLSNIVTESQIKMDSSKQAAVAKLTSDPTWASKSSAEQAGAMAGAIGAIDPEAGIKMGQVASNELLKEQQTIAKKSENDLKQIGTAVATIKGATPEQYEGLLNSMPEETRRTIKNKIPGFFEETDRNLQKQQLQALMESNTPGAMLARIEANKQIEIMREADRVRHDQQIHDDKIRLREIGSDSKQSSLDQRDRGAYHRGNSSIDRDFKDELKVANDALAAASRNVDLSKPDVQAKKSFGFEQTGDFNKYVAAKKTVDDIQKKKLEAKLSNLEIYPEGPQKDRFFKDLNKQLESYDTEEDKPTLKAEGAEAKPAAATGLQGQVEKSGQKYEPTKYDYRVAPDGSVQRKAK